MTQRVELLAGQRKKGESYRAILACNDYLRMGATRSVRRVHEGYANTRKNSHVPSFYTMRKWCEAYEWQKRAEEHDAQIDAEKMARAREIMQSGLALDYERLAELKRLVGFLRPRLVGIGSRRSSRELSYPDYHPAARRNPEPHDADRARTDHGLDFSMKR